MTFADTGALFAAYVVMERLGITTAFALDKHFRQFGTVAVVP